MAQRYILLSVCTAFILSNTALAQTWQWAVSGEGPTNSVANTVAVDTQGNSIVAGSYSGSITIGAQTLSSPDLDGIFLAKFDADGTPLWAHIVANGTGMATHGVSVDDAGRIAITGIYMETVAFMPFVFGPPLTAVGAFDVFTAFYTPDGDPLWARSLGGTGFDYGAGVSHDAEGNVYVNGEFHEFPFNLSGSKIFIAKYDVTGHLLWTTQSDTYGNNHLGDGIATDAAGTSCIVGEFFTELTFGGIVLNPGNPELTVYAAKVNTDGEVLWAQQAGAGGYAAGEGVGMDADGNAYITGFYYGSSTFGTFTLPNTNGNIYDPFVAKCASSDGTFQWAVTATGPGVNDLAWGISVDSAGNSYVNGSFAGTLTVGSTTLQTAGGTDMFIAKYSPTGTALWATSCGSPDSEAIGDVVVRGSDVFVVGGYTGSIVCDTDVSLTGQPTVQDAFVAKLTDEAINGIHGPEAITFAVYPDPVVDRLNVRGLHRTGHYVIVDMHGRTVRTGSLTPEQTITVADLPEGAYVLRVNTGETTEQLKFIKR